ncbi:MAG: hypothetical protein WAX57_05315 [Minisyncoccia bacterium]
MIKKKYTLLEQFQILRSKSDTYRARADRRITRLEKAVFDIMPPTPARRRLDPITLLARVDRLEAAMKRRKHA